MLHLDAAGIIVNKNAVPYDEKPPAVASGIRLGTPIVSTRGMRQAEMTQIVDLIDRVLTTPARSICTGRRPCPGESPLRPVSDFSLLLSSFQIGRGLHL